MANIRNNRWEYRGILKNSSHPEDQHPQVRRENDATDDTIEEIPQESESDE